MSIYNHSNKFISNKYQNWYYSIIEKAISQHRRKRTGIYYESHHILPKSLFPEYKKEFWNIVLLTPREHFKFLCLYKILNN